MKTKFTSNNKLIIIGNGFDLAHGLKTSYADFLYGYFCSCIQSFRKNAFEKYEGYSDDLIKISKPEIPIIDFSSIDDVKRRFLNNAQDRYLIKNGLFKELIENINENWVDIEAFYYEKVKGVFDQTKSEFLESKEELQESINKHRSRIIQLNLELEQVKKAFLEYLKEQSLNIRTLPEVRRFLEENIAINDEKGRVYFLNFNYTNTIENYFNSMKEVEVNFIHGDLLKKDSHIIFGYGDEEDEYYKKIENLRIDEYFDNFKSFGYSRARNYQQLLNEMKDGKFDVFIFGHSCGFSDKVLLKTIFEHDNCEKIHIRYHKWGSLLNENDHLKKTMQISRLFSNKGQFRERVVNFEESRPLC